MWPFNKKTSIGASGILAGATDYHSHILPGVDDGVESMEEALRILAAYEELGIKELWLTPHIMEDIPNTPEKLQARFAELTSRYKGSITLHLAAEYMIDNHLRSLLMNCHSVTNNCPSFERGTVVCYLLFFFYLLYMPQKSSIILLSSQGSSLNWLWAVSITTISAFSYATL